MALLLKVLRGKKSLSFLGKNLWIVNGKEQYHPLESSCQIRIHLKKKKKKSAILQLNEPWKPQV